MKAPTHNSQTERQQQETQAASPTSLARPLDETMPPKISVVIPCCNAEAYIEEAIRSVINQSLPPREVIVIDDGSTDGSAAVADSVDPMVRVISQQNRGVSVARNRGFEEAKGDWIAFLDADDLWEPTKLEEQVKLIANDVVCIHTAYYRFGADRRTVNYAKVPPTKRYSLEFIAVNGVLNPSSILVRSSIRARFPKGIKQAEDVIFSLDLCHEGRLRMVPRPLVGYRVHTASATARHDVHTLWHKSVMAWLRESGVDSATRRRIERGWNDRLVVVALLCFLLGRFVEFRVLFKYVRCLRIGLGGWIAAPFRFFRERWRYVFRSALTG